ncbi:hypothetical protein PHMEG_00013296 [Phytophthora megakarya]|uniref:Uncharacterized protein n=1 Tax=Phytophthora megakarya TaxID=4795 RepID=A0A225W7L2_9STRA|nr:hypothetical protein PHMEG_00013296 [Phytophthora megakarya]
MKESQTDWNLYVKVDVYAYNNARHSTVALPPNELIMGKRLRHPNELLRRPDIQEAGDLQAYHKWLVVAMKRSYECVELARRHEQERQARYYNRKVRQRREFRPGDLVWLHNPPRRRKATKFVHQRMGPMKVVEQAGYENDVLMQRDKTGKEETVIAHESFMVSYHYPVTLLEKVAHDIDERLVHEDPSERSQASTTTTALIGTATASPTRTASTSGRATSKRPTKRSRTTVADHNDVCDERGWLVERRRRRRRNRAGQYILEYELYSAGDMKRWRTGDAKLWKDDDGRVTARDYEKRFTNGRVVEDPSRGEVV